MMLVASTLNLNLQLRFSIFSRLLLSPGCFLLSYFRLHSASLCFPLSCFLPLTLAVLLGLLQSTKLMPKDPLVPPPSTTANALAVWEVSCSLCIVLAKRRRMGTTTARCTCSRFAFTAIATTATAAATATGSSSTCRFPSSSALFPFSAAQPRHGQHTASRASALASR